MTAYIKTFLVFTLLIMLTASCQRKDELHDTHPPDPYYVGTLKVKITLVDAGSVLQTGANLYTGFSVSVNDNNGKVYTPTPDSTGSFFIPNIHSGSYLTFMISKPGYGAIKTNTTGLYPSGNGDTLQTGFTLSQMPTNNVSSVQAYTTTVTYTMSTGLFTDTIIRINGTFPSSTENTSFVTFVSLPNHTSVDGTPGNYYDDETDGPYAAGRTSFSYLIRCSGFIKPNGFTHGSTVYLATYIYGPSTSYNSNYFPALSSTPIITSVVLP